MEHQNIPFSTRAAVAYSGNVIAGVCKVGSYSLTPARTTNVYRKRVRNVEEYHEDCKIPGHNSCVGHICTDKFGNNMIPGPMCLMVGDTTDTMMDLASALLLGRMDGEEYRKGINGLMLGKKGIFRGKALSGVISGSIRMVIIPAWDLEINEIYLPRYIIPTLKVPCRTRNGSDISVYEYRVVKEGDYAIAIRPPTLSETSLQPVRIKFWDRTCIGISPLNCGELHADFDGDELQVFPINTYEAIEECKAWNLVSRPLFNEKAIEEEYLGKATVRDFMKYTTITLEDVLSNIEVTTSQEDAKVKHSSFAISIQQIAMSGDIDKLIEGSIDGFRSIARQQLTQGSRGHESRLARNATLDFISKADSVQFISQDVGYSEGGYTVPSISLDGAHAGSPACVLASRICAVVQQSYLDSHRAQQSNVTRFDMASSFITGTSDCIILSKVSQKCVWEANIGDIYVCYVSTHQSLNFTQIVGCYASSILAKIAPKKRFSVAVRGIEFLMRYYRVESSVSALCALAYAIVSGCENSEIQPTGVDGVLSRDYRWLTKLAGTHWNNLNTIPSDILSRRYNVDTIVEASMFGNFAAIPSVLEYDK